MKSVTQMLSARHVLVFPGVMRVPACLLRCNMKMKLYCGCLAALLFSPSVVTVRGQAPSGDVPSFTARGAFVAIVVTDLDASVHWYESNLGLRLVKRGKSPRVPAETVVLGGRNLFVELIHHQGKALP